MGETAGTSLRSTGLVSLCAGASADRRMGCAERRRCGTEPGGRGRLARRPRPRLPAGLRHEADDGARLSRRRLGGRGRPGRGRRSTRPACPPPPPPARASGLLCGGAGPPLARPGPGRIYSNVGFEALADVVAKHAEMPFGEYLDAAVFEPLQMTRTDLRGSPAAEVHGTLDDLVR